MRAPQADEYVVRPPEGGESTRERPFVDSSVPPRPTNQPRTGTGAPDWRTERGGTPKWRLKAVVKLLG